MGDKRKFEIGQSVLVNLNNQLKPGYDEKDYRAIRRLKDWHHGRNRETTELQLAKITGVKLFHEGHYNKGSSSVFGYGGHYEDYESPYLTVKGTVHAWAVRLGYKNKELYFLYEDIEVLVNEGCPDDKNIPYFYCAWNDYYRKKMSEESKDWPRDKQGKWA